MTRYFARAALALGSLLLALTGHAANPQVDIDTSLGRIRIELLPDAAPKTVENFITYVKARHFDGTQFHRVIPGFMIQGGGFTGDFKQKPTRTPLQHEGEANRKAGVTNAPGTIAMARTGDPHSASAQFFINVADNRRLDYREPTPSGFGYVVFGRVVEGMEVVGRIAAARTGPGGPFPSDVPQETVSIKSATLVAGKP